MKPNRVVCLLFVYATLVSAAPAPKPPPPPDHPNGGAMTIYKDPVTGRLMPMPAGREAEILGDAAARKRSTSHEGLVAVPAPGGGVMINLQGRFQHAMQASVNASGTVTGQCDGDAQNAQARKE